MSTIPPHILIVDDAEDIRDPLSSYMRQNGMNVTTAEDAATARRHMTSIDFDLMVLDVMMPGEDGLSLCRDIRSKSPMPIILLTAMAEETDRVVGLELGADDYVTKPFSPRELLARIRSVLRRKNTPAEAESEQSDGTYLFSGWKLKIGERELQSSDGVAVPISTAEFHLLTVFLTHPKKVLNREQLLELAHGRQANLFDRSIDNQISRLRRKIEPDAKKPTLIKTVWGGGYMLAADVKVQE